MESKRKQYYKYCIVPLCPSTTFKTPDKIFIRVPQDKSRRLKWLKACSRNGKDMSDKTTGHVCEDHFNLEEDMDNYLKFKLMGGLKKIKANVLPHIFENQPERKRAFKTSPKAAANKRIKRRIVDETVASSSKNTSKAAANMRIKRTIGDKTVASSSTTQDQVFDQDPVHIVGSSSQNSTISLCPRAIPLRTSDTVLDNKPAAKDLTTGKRQCRLCFQYVCRNQLVCLGNFHNDMYPNRNSDFKRNKILQSNMYLNMIKVVLPEFDHDIVSLPVLCNYCTVKLEKASNFIEMCMDNQEIIKKYKDAVCPFSESVSCEEVTAAKIHWNERFKRKWPNSLTGSSKVAKIPLLNIQAYDETVQIPVGNNVEQGHSETAVLKDISSVEEAPDIEEKVDISTIEFVCIKTEPSIEDHIHHPITSNQSTGFPVQLNTEILKTRVKTEPNVSTDVSNSIPYFVYVPSNDHTYVLKSTDIIPNDTVVIKTEPLADNCISDTAIVIKKEMY